MASTATRAEELSATATRGRFVWTELVTTNVAAAQTFYKKVVGWNTSKWKGVVRITPFS